MKEFLKSESHSCINIFHGGHFKRQFSFLREVTAIDINNSIWEHSIVVHWFTRNMMLGHFSCGHITMDVPLIKAVLSFNDNCWWWVGLGIIAVLSAWMKHFCFIYCCWWFGWSTTVLSSNDKCCWWFWGCIAVLSIADNSLDEVLLCYLLMMMAWMKHCCAIYC